MITIPELKPELLRALEADFGTTIAQSIWHRLALQQNFVDASLPLGLVVWFWASQTYANGSPVSIGSNWKFCDGSIISDSNSPMNGYPTPNLTGRYVRGGSTNVGYGGASSVSHSHGHSILAGGGMLNDGASAIGGDVPLFLYPHTHGLPGIVTMTFSIVPKYVVLHPYMRVR